jgi:hypothetical protein
MTSQIRSTIQRTAALLWEAFKYLGVAFYTLLAVSTVSLLWSPPENGCATGVFGGLMILSALSVLIGLDVYFVTRRTDSLFEWEGTSERLRALVGTVGVSTVVYGFLFPVVLGLY